MSARLTDLPNALIECIVLEIEQLRDIASLAQTCRALRALVYAPSDSHLWRLLFLQRYDDPRRLARLLHEDLHIDWASMLKERRQTVSRIARSADCRDAVTHAPLETELRHLLDALHHAEPGMGDRPAVQMVLDAAHAQPVLTYSGRPGESARKGIVSRRQIILADDDALKPKRFDSFADALSQLSTYFGVDRARFALEHRQGARAAVYSLDAWRQNDWSPFNKDTGRIEWHRVESLVLVACTNATELCQASADRALPPCRLECARPFTQPHWDEQDGDDWAGIGGIWRRCINFMDWHVLFAYQRAIDRGSVTSPVEFFGRFENPEAVHVHAWRFVVTDTVKNPSQPRFPDLFWAGEMIDHDIYAHPPTLRGRVRMTDHGDVMWNSVTRFEGVDAYCSSGVQIGGVRAAFGVVGLWSGINHEQGDPAGPNYMWRVDEKEDDLLSAVLN